MAQNESSDSSLSDLKNQVANLERQVFSLLLILIVVAGTVTAYLYRQASTLGKEIQATRPQVEQITQVVSENHQMINSFLNQLATYAQSHPDFQKQVMAKNGLNPPGTTPSAGAPVAPK
jgi:hypothetical protein